MTPPLEIFAVTPRAAKRATGIVLVLLWLALGAAVVSRPAVAAETPDKMVPPPAPKSPKPMVDDPAEMMAEMVRQLEKNPDFVVLMVESLPITQRDMADVVRTMPTNLANLGFPEVSRRALDVLVSQKAMVLNARKEGLDKDPAVLRRENVAIERVLSDAWLKKVEDAAVTDQALHTRYDREVANRPGPEEVRARLIQVPTEQEAREIITKVQNGGDFADLARTYSKAPNAAEGGDVGYVPIGDLTPELGPVTFALAPGQITGFPVATPVGYFIVRVEGRRRRGTPTFDEARPWLEREIRAETAQAAIDAVMSKIKLVPGAKPGGDPGK
jgi:peptidyl-prolyl cis-trans isomerase C